MTTLLAHLWPGLVAALALGLAVGLLAGRPGRWTLAGHLGLLAGVAAATLLVPGRAGLWLEGAGLMLALYLATAAAALAVRRPQGSVAWSSREPESTSLDDAL